MAGGKKDKQTNEGIFQGYDEKCFFMGERCWSPFLSEVTRILALVFLTSLRETLLSDFRNFRPCVVRETTKQTEKVRPSLTEI